jgi:hypothetical protein
VARGAQGAPGQGVRQGVRRWPGGKVARGVRTRSVEKTRVKSGFVFPILLRRKSIFPVQRGRSLPGNLFMRR